MNPERDAFFEKLNNDRQDRYDATVCRAILRCFGVPTTTVSMLERMAEQGASDVCGFTPEWLSQHLGSPVIFRAVRGDADTAVVNDLQWLFTHKVDGKASKFWSSIWQESVDRHGNCYIAVCFKVPWSSQQLCFHNYHYVATLSADCAGGTMFWHTRYGTIFLQSLSDLIAVISKTWRPLTQ